MPTVAIPAKRLRETYSLRCRYPRCGHTVVGDTPTEAKSNFYNHLILAHDHHIHWDELPTPKKAIAEADVLARRAIARHRRLQFMLFH